MFNRSRQALLRSSVVLLGFLIVAGAGEPADGKTKKSLRKVRKEVIRQLKDGEVFPVDAFRDVPLAEDTGRIDLRLPKRFRNSDAARRLAGLIARRKGEHTRPARKLEGHQSTVPAIGDDFTKQTFHDQPAFQIVGRAAAIRRETGAGVVVAVLDSGVDRRHEILRDRLRPGLDLLDGDNAPWEVANGIDDDGDGRIDEGHGHGTFVAGVIVGLAPNVRIMPVRVLSDEGNGDSFGLADGIYHAVRNGADVICLSLGMDGYSVVVRAAADYAEQKGVVLVCAAVQREGPGTPLQMPAMFPTSLAVTSLDLTDRKPSWAAAHSQVGIAAPGVGIIGPWPGEGGKNYALGGGTSFATALVAGAAALVVGNDGHLTPEQVRAVLLDAAKDVSRDNPGWNGLLGAGRLSLGEIFP